MVKILPFLQHFFLYIEKFPWSKNYYLEKVLFVARFKNFLHLVYYIKQKNTFLNLDMNLRIPEMHSFYWILRRFWSYGSMQFCQQECYRILNYLLWKTAVNHMAIGPASKTYIGSMPVFSQNGPQFSRSRQPGSLYLAWAGKHICELLVA